MFADKKYHAGGWVMSMEAAKGFVEKARSNKELCDDLAAATDSATVEALLRENGVDCTVAELRKVLTESLQDPSLTDDELAAIAGGAEWKPVDLRQLENMSVSSMFMLVMGERQKVLKDVLIGQMKDYRHKSSRIKNH